MLGEKKNVFFQTRLFPPCGSINITYYLMWKKILLWRSRSKPHPVWMFIYIFIYKLEIRKVSHADRHLHSPTFTVIFICVLFTLFNPVDLPFENPFFLLLQSVPIKECCGSPPGSFRVFSEAIYKPPRVDSVDWIGVGIFPCDGSKINMAKVEKEHACWPSSCLKTPSSSSKAQRTSKNEDSPKKRPFPSVTAAFLDPSWNPWTCHWKPWRVLSGAVDKLISGGFLITTMTSGQQQMIYLRACPLFPVIFTSLVSQVERSVRTDGHKSLPCSPPALSLPHKPTLSLSWLNKCLLQPFGTEFLLWARPYAQRLACIASFNPHTPYGVGVIVPAQEEAES